MLGGDSIGSGWVSAILMVLECRVGSILVNTVGGDVLHIRLISILFLT
jgi:hypothetical protein